VSEEACVSKILLTTGDGHVLALALVERRKCLIILMFYSRSSDNDVIMYVLYIFIFIYIYIQLYTYVFHEKRESSQLCSSWLFNSYSTVNVSTFDQRVRMGGLLGISCALMGANEVWDELPYRSFIYSICMYMFHVYICVQLLYFYRT